MFGLLALALAIMLSGCGGPGAAGGGEPPGMEGYVVKKDNGRILVVDPVPQDFSENGGMPEFYNAIWFSGAPAHAEVGRKVQVWFDAVAESYPGQSTAKRVNVLTSPKPAGADLTEAEAIRASLESRDFPWPAAVKRAEYDANADAWTVTIHHEGDVQDIAVEDRR